VLKAFESATGIRVRAVYDVEAAKTTGVVNRLLAEKNRPQADVFWNSEFAQTLLLREQGVLAAYDSPAAVDIPEQFRDQDRYWTGIAGRARVIIVNTQRLAGREPPRSIHDLLNDEWPADQVAMAYPLMGTTCTQAAALYAAWGGEKARDFFSHVKARGVRIVDGNATVRDMVADGRLLWGLTDTDDAAGAIERGAPVSVIFPDQREGGQGTPVMPNTVALVAGAPHPEAGRRLIDYLLSRDVERDLVQAGWSHAPVRDVGVTPRHIGVSNVRPLNVKLQEVYRHLDRAKRELSEVFVR
jgi:iron(III) transport system substrate-binding protein